MTRRVRLLVLAVVCLVALGATIGYLVVRRADRTAATQAATGPPTVAASQLAGGPRIYVRNTALGPDYGRVAMVALADPGGPRAILPASCDRLDVVASRSICLFRDSGVVTTYRAGIGDAQFTTTTSQPLPGFPSRARLSPDGRLVATTTFVAGDSYVAQGFSTRTYITDVRTGTGEHLEDFALTHEGRAVSPTDRNYWGVTFLDDDRRFYVTVAFGGSTWLALGDLATRSVTTVAGNVECPSVSPDRTRVAFKKRVGGAADPWRLTVRDLASGTETRLAETRSVDDQVTWLDDSTIVYGVPRGTAGTASADVWSVRADGSGQPTRLIEDALSPAVVR